jgi:hypothetical protein
MQCNPKIVVFDLDETLGYFVELGIFWDSLKEYIKENKIQCEINQKFFNKILDLYPEFLRPNIIGILNYLKKKKQQNKCAKLMIYTNNQGPREWAHNIMRYFENKLNTKLFDQIIAAFKIKGEYIEMCRTTHMKTHKDFIKCTKMPDNTEICFLDDVFYPDMNNEKIYYINIKPYIYDLELDTMVDRFIGSNICKIDDTLKCKEQILGFSNKFHYIYTKKSSIEYNVDKVLSKKILQHLHLFFGKYNDTKKNIKNIKNVKNIHNKTFKIKVSDK